MCLKERERERKRARKRERASEREREGGCKWWIQIDLCSIVWLENHIWMHCKDWPLLDLQSGARWPFVSKFCPLQSKICCYMDFYSLSYWGWEQKPTRQRNLTIDYMLRALQLTTKGAKMCYSYKSELNYIITCKL